MGKSKGPRVRKERANRNDTAKPVAALPRPSLWARIGTVWKVGGAIVGAALFLAHTYAGTIPVVHVLGPDPSPFLLPFVVSNESLFFKMENVTFFCGPRHGKSIQVGNVVVQDVEFQDNVPATTIGRGEVKLMRCPVTNATGNSVKGTIHPIVQYRTLGFDRKFEGKDLNWFGNANPPRWVEGDVVK